ncbi:hypothetical protein CMK14_12670 [Candidatus Poribacteria bacterium]|nr:hypothetical protein [Candidatus Poribacteria bacterium]
MFGGLFSPNIQRVDLESLRSKYGTNFTKELTFAIQSSMAGNIFDHTTKLADQFRSGDQIPIDGNFRLRN